MIGLTSPTPQPNPKRVRPIAVFKPLPWQTAPWRDTSSVMLLTGSAGGGKSRLAAEKVHGFCLRYPGTTALVLRKTRQSMVNSTVLFLERKIIGRDPRVQHYPSKHRFEYWNGSILAYGGMADDEQREQVRSIGQDGGVDIIWNEEANQFEENDYNELIARNRAKAGGFRQIILTTNPDSPLHWIYRRLIVGKEAAVYYSGAGDNQYNPDDYRASLARMTGLEGQRLREGVWAQATGLVFDTWRDGPSDGNVTDDAEYIEGGGSTYLAVDDGYTGERDAATGYYTAESHPRVFLWCQLRNDGRLAVFNESYAVKTLSPQHTAEVMAMGYPEPNFAAVDKSAAQLRGLLHGLNIYTRGGPSSVEESVKELREWISPDANGVRRFIVHTRCKQLRAEFAAYRYDPHNEKGDKVIKAFDHGVDAARYLCWTLRHE
jgi:hypothetical protein